ncbi:MAG: hypothetical protein ACRDH2_16090, partial [Anaerolineales bacterium]
MKSRLRLLFALRGLLVGLIGVGLFAGAAPGRAASAPGIVLAMRAGFDGYYKDGRWMPVRISVANDGPDARGTLRILAPRNDGNEVVFTRAVELPTQSRREIFMYIPAEGFVNNLDVTLNDGRNLLAKTNARLTQAGASDLVYGVLASSPSSFSGVLGNIDPLNGSAFVAQLEASDLPPAGQAWQGLDSLVVSDVDTGALSPEQRASLKEWVTNGGQLIVMGGPSWQKTAAGLSDLLPVLPSSTQNLASLEALAVFASAPVPDGSAVAAVGTLTPDAVTWVNGSNVPLVVARRLGLGQVTFLAVDPAFAPLKGWDGLEGLFRNILAAAPDRPSWAAGLRNWYSARDAVNALPGLNLPSTWQICGFLGLYIVVIGPLNYLALKRLRRRELAWVTIPGLVLIFSAATYLTGYQLRGAQASLHRLTLVQVWPDSEQARVDQIVGLFSPRRSAYDLQFAEGFLVRPMPSDGSYG